MHKIETVVCLMKRDKKYHSMSQEDGQNKKKYLKEYMKKYLNKHKKKNTLLCRMLILILYD